MGVVYENAETQEKLILDKVNKRRYDIRVSVNETLI